MNHLTLTAEEIKTICDQEERTGTRLELYVLDPDGKVRRAERAEHAEFLATHPFDTEDVVGNYRLVTAFFGVVVDGVPAMYSTALFDERNGQYIVSRHHADRPSAFDFHQAILMKLDTHGND